MTVWFRRVLPILLVSLIAALPTALAGKLADLPWDDKLPKELRSGVRRALEKEQGDFAKQLNAAGKQWIWMTFSPNEIDQRGDSALVPLTVQRCLDDKRITERWRYELRKKDTDYEITKRTKEAETDEAYPTVIEKPETARPLKPFTFTHDVFTLKMDSGVYTALTYGGQPVGLRIAGKGHMKVSALDDQEAVFFIRGAKTATIDTDVSEVSLTFDARNTTFTDLIGWTAAGGAPGGAAATKDELSALHDMLDKRIQEIDERKYKPNLYSPPNPVEQKDSFVVRMKTAGYDTITYYVDPTGEPSYQVAVQRETQMFSLNKDAMSGKLLGLHPLPEVRKLGALEMSHRRGLRWVSPYKYDATFDIDGDRFTGRVDVTATMLRDSRDLYFSLTGNPTIRSVRMLDGRELLVEPAPYEDYFDPNRLRSNRFRLLFPETLKAGTDLELSFVFDSPETVNKVNDGFWNIDRFGFLPFMGALDEKCALHLVMRTPDPYTHLGVGSLMSTEKVGGYRYTEWGSDVLSNFPTLIVGKYFDPVVKQVGDITVTGYMTNSFLGARSFPGNASVDYEQVKEIEIPTADRQMMVPQVDQAAEAVDFYAKIYRFPYPYKDLKLIGTPAQGLSAQSPSSMVYIGEYIFWPLPYLQVVGPEIFGSGFDPMWVKAVTAHEVAHQWWGGRVSNITGRSYWFVETLAEVSAFLYTEAIKDTVGRQHTLYYWKSSGMVGDAECTIDRPEFAVTGGGALLRYTKGPLVVNMLRNYYGTGKLLNFMSGLLQTFNGDLISTEDIKLYAQNAFGEDMSWFFDQYVTGMGIPDIGYKFEDARPAEDGKGWIITGKLTQDLKHAGKVVPGKYFKHVLVPMVVDTVDGPKQLKEFIDGATKDVTLRVDSKPKGLPQIQQDEMWMTIHNL